MVSSLSTHTKKKAMVNMKRKSISMRKSQMFKAISAVSLSKELHPSYAELHEEDMDGFMDETGKTIRWQRMSEAADPVYAKGKCFGRGERIYSDTEAVELVNQINEDLYEKLEARRKAISNWKRLKIVIVILKMSGGRVDESGQDDKEDKEEPRMQTCDEWFSKFVIMPFSRYIIGWNIFMTMVYLFSIIQDTLIMGFHLRLLLIPEMNMWQMVFSLVMIIDIILRFFVAIRQSQTEEDKEEDNEEEISFKATKKSKVDAEDEDENEDDVALSRKQK